MVGLHTPGEGEKGGGGVWGCLLPTQISRRTGDESLKYMTMDCGTTLRYYLAVPLCTIHATLCL